MARKLVAAKRRSRSEGGDQRVEIAVLILRKMLGSLREVEPQAS